MEQTTYQLECPTHLGRKTELNKAGFKPGGNPVAILETENGREYALFDKGNLIPLTLADESYDLISWRDGLKSKPQPTIEDLNLIEQIEQTVKGRLLETAKTKANLRMETLYFVDEYSKHGLGKKIELNRQGLKAEEVVGYYVNVPDCTALYSLKTSQPLLVQTATKQELTRWREGLSLGQIELSEKDRESLIREIDERLLMLNDPKEKGEKSGIKSRKVKTDDKNQIESDYLELKKAFQSAPDEFCILSVVGTGVLEFDEVLQLVILNMDGSVVYQKSFMPISERLRKECYPVPIGMAKWSHEINQLKPIFESKSLIVFNPDYELKMIEQTSSKCEINPLISQVTKALPMVKHLTGFSSLEGASKQHSFKVNQSNLTWNARLSAYMLLSILNPEADIFKTCKDLNVI